MKQSKILSHAKEIHHKYGRIILILANGPVDNRRLELYLAANEITNYEYLSEESVENEGVESVIYTYKYG